MDAVNAAECTRIPKLKDFAMKLCQQIADRIANDFMNAPRGLLPSMRELRAKYKVSRPTLLKAAHILREQGILEVSQGRRMRLVSGADSSPKTHPPCFVPSAQRFADSLAEDIANGIYRLGKELPKQTYFASKHGISVRTVRKAYQLLADRKLVYRRGRGWAAGTPVQRPAMQRRMQRFTIAVAMRRPGDWAGLSTQSRSQKFIESFVNEAESFGVDIVIAVRDSRKGSYVIPTVTGEPRPLAAFARELGPAYLGTLIINNLQELPELRTMIVECLEFGRTVWCDRSGVNVNNPPCENNFARCHYSEEAVVAEALQALADLGHTAVAYVRPAGETGWVAVRGNMLAQIGREMLHPVHVLQIQPGGNYEEKSAAFPLREKLETFCDRYPAFDRRFRALMEEVGATPNQDLLPLENDYYDSLAALMQFIRKRGEGGGFPGRHGSTARLARITPMMIAVLEQRDVTAVVVPRDIYALRCIQWLEIAGIQVPRDMSVISFDNSFHRNPTSLASVDPGFNHLGYQAFHFLFDDIRPRRDAHGNIPARARVSRWGTIGPARNRPLPRSRRGLSM